MYHIAVCDDEQILAKRLGGLLREIFTEKGADVKVSIFLSGKQLLEKADGLDVVFLDIEMPEMDGIETGMRLHRLNPECRIVMVSGMEHRMKEGFFVGAKRFVTKPISRKELSEAVNAVLMQAPGMQEIRLFLNNQSYSLRQNQISYLEAYNGYTVFHVKDRIFRREENLKHFSDELDPRLFVQISRKHIVNLGKVRDTNLKDSLRLGGESLSISRRLREDFKRKFTEYDLNYGGC